MSGPYATLGYSYREDGRWLAMLDMPVLDREDDRPPYQQIADVLRNAITAGKLASGEKLPSEPKLVEHFGVARMTARQAIQALKGEGLVVSEHGKGVFVRPVPPVRRLASDRFARAHRDEGRAAFLAEAESIGYVPGVDQINVGHEPVPDAVARLLALEPGSDVVVRSRRYLANGRPIEVATSYIPASFAAGTAIEQDDTGPGGLYARLEENGHTLERFTEQVGARMPTPQERRQLDLSAGIPVLLVLRTAYDVDGNAVEVCDTIKAAPAYQLEYDFPAR